MHTLTNKILGGSCKSICTNGKDTYHEWNLREAGACYCGEKRLNPKIFVVTDGCMWERNKVEGTKFPHSIEVMDETTGQMRYIKTGARIAFLEGEISEARNQEGYNRQSGERNEA